MYVGFTQTPELLSLTAPVPSRSFPEVYSCRPRVLLVFTWVVRQATPALMYSEQPFGNLMQAQHIHSPPGGPSDSYTGMEYTY